MIKSKLKLKTKIRVSDIRRNHLRQITPDFWDLYRKHSITSGTDNGERPLLEDLKLNNGSYRHIAEPCTE